MDSPTPPDELPDETAKATQDSEPPEPPVSPALRRQALADVLLIAGVYLLPNVYNAIAGWFQPVARQPLVQAELSLAVQAIAFSVLGLYLIFRSGEPPATFGLSRPRASDFFFGLVLWLLLFVALFVTRLVPSDLFGLPYRSSEELFSPPRTAVDYLLVGVSSALNGFGEEVIMRAVLITQLRRLLRSSAKAVLLSATLFGLYHVYYGVRGALDSFVIGLILGVDFQWSRRLWPVAVAHAMQDFMPMVWLGDAAR